jgi:hypothetical protein
LFRDGRVSADLRHDLQTLADYRALQSCLSGPGVQLPPHCAAADRDGNRTRDRRPAGLRSILAGVHGTLDSLPR